MATEVLRLEDTPVAVLLRPAKANEVVALRLYARGGSTTIGAAQAGADLLYARSARRGTENFPKAILNAELARMGSEVGCRADEDLTVFHLRCLRRHFERSWEIFVDVVSRPLLASEDIEVVRRQMLLAIRQRDDDPDGRLGDVARAHVYSGHPYAPNPDGTLESVSALDADALRAHARARLLRANLFLVAVGDLEPEMIATRVRDAFAALPAGNAPVPLPPALAFTRSRLQSEARELPTNYILGQFAAPALADADHPAAMVTLSVLRDRLFEEVRTKRNLSYAPGAGLGSHAANLGWIYVTATEPQPTMRVMLDEMRRLCDQTLDAKELHDKVQVYVTSYHLQNETNQAQASFLARYELLGGGWQRAGAFVSRLEALTPAEIRTSAQAMFRQVQYTYLGDVARADPAVFVDP